MDASNLDIVANYLNNKLGEEEKNNFEKELISNTSLKSDTDNLSLVKQIAERSRILNQAKLIHKREMESLKKPSLKVIPLVKIASFAAAASLVFMIYLGNSDVKYIEISSVERGLGTQQSALQNFEQGIDLLKQNKNDEALVEFNHVIDNQNIEEYYRDASLWYEVVALSNMNEDLKAKEMLKSIEGDERFKYKISFLDKLRIKFRLL
jgi:hypothetical protein